MSLVTRVFSLRRPSFLPLGREKVLKAEFERVALPHLSELYRAAFYLTRYAPEAGDLVQETYLRAFRFFDQFEPGTNCRAWLLTILRNLFVNRYRQKAREPEVLDCEEIERSYGASIERAEEHCRSDPESLVFSRIVVDKIETALKKLPEEFRTAIILVDIEELTYEQAGKVMGCPIGTVRSRVSRGRRILQVALRDYAVQSG